MPSNNTKIVIIFINSKSSKPLDSHRLVFNPTDQIKVKRSDKYFALSNLSICYTWKNIQVQEI